MSLLVVSRLLDYAESGCVQCLAQHRVLLGGGA
jgi:hypothetical protein